MFKKTVVALGVATVAALSGCGTAPLAHTGTATINVSFPEHNANVTTSNGASCNSPCSFNYTVDLTKDVLVSDNVTYTWPSGATYVLRINATRSDVNRLGTAISFALPPNINTAERLTTNRAPATRAPEKSVLESFAEGLNETTVNCTTTHIGILSKTRCR